jgi:hypothetical protein
MSYDITQEEVDRILNEKGDVRGVVFKTDYLFVLNRFGEEGVKKVEEEMKRMGCPFDYEKQAINMSFYPIGMRVISLIAISNVFNFNREEVVEMGRTAPKFSMIVKFFIGYFLSIESVFEKAGSMWEKHYTAGYLESAEINEKEQYTVIRIHETNLHPIFCDYLCGYFSSIVKMAVGKDIQAEEKKCTHKGDDYHEIILKW